MLKLALILSLLLPAVNAARAPAGAQPAGSAGRQWVRRNPFLLMGLCLYDRRPDMALYRDAGLNCMLAWMRKRHDDPAGRAGAACASGACLLPGGRFSPRETCHTAVNPPRA